MHLNLVELLIRRIRVGKTHGEGVRSNYKRTPNRVFPITLIGFGLIMEIAYLSLLAMHHCGFPNTIFLTWYIGVSLFCGLLWLALIHRRSSSQSSVAIIFFFAIVFRLTLISAPPTASGDVFRYVWDGKVSSHGINPYRFTPMDEALKELRSVAIHPNINHRNLPTIYPPLAEGTFAIAYLLGGDSLIGIKLLSLLTDLLTMRLLWSFLNRTRIADPYWVVAYAWCPLSILEFMTACHVDGFGLPFLILFYWALHEKKAIPGALALAAATLVKIFPALLLPFLFQAIERKKRPLAVLVFGSVIATGWSPFFWGGVDPFHSLKVYAWNWHFNSPTFSYSAAYLGDGFQARFLCLTLFLIGSGCLFFLRKQVMERIQGIWMTFFLLGTTVFPWHLTWLTPGFVVTRSFPALWLTATASLTYVTELGYRTNGEWRESHLVWIIEFAPIVTWLIWRGATFFLKQKRERPATKAVAPSLQPLPLKGRTSD